MRPVRLTMQAFGPYPEREVIDFRDAVEAGLFGIYGQTGSGKSTIFSAMTFALFGEPVKADQDAPSLRSDHADAGVQTEVEFVFDIGEQRFVVLRRPDQMRPKQRGDGETRNPHEAFLFDATGLALDDIGEEQRGKIVAEKKVRDVDAAISEMLGYGPEQFRQIVLLPQGRFETFLSAKTKERLEILRDLFDVSLYRSLAAKLKTDAEVAERHVREEREVCARRLSAEGFESTDALIAGIADTEAHHAELLDAENDARKAFETAQAALALAEKIGAQFEAAEEAQEALTELLAGKAEIDALAKRVNRAERARSLLDAEAHVAETAKDFRKAEVKLEEARAAAETSEKKAISAAEALREENDRAEEIEALRRKVEELDRHKQAVQKSAGITEAVEKARAAERAATEKFDGARKQLTERQDKRRNKAEALKKARLTEARRQEITACLIALTSALAAAETFDKAEAGVLTARAEVERLNSDYEMAARRAEEARVGFEEAERSLSAAQALHLATKLEVGEPCPVCGAIEHPAPATGAIEHAGRDQVFREAKADWQKADKAARGSGEKLAGARSALGEREDRLASLDRPDNTTASLKDKVQDERQTLDGLGPETNIAEADAEIDRLDGEIETLETDLDALRDALSGRQRTTVSEKARLEEMLAAVPEVLRDQDALAAARECASQSLSDLQAAGAAAEKAATDTREAALAARKDCQAANEGLSDCRERHCKAVDAFRSRLEQVGLSEEDFRSLKPAIATIDEDRATVQEHLRKLENARETAKKAAEAIRDQVRPDLSEVDAKRRAAEEKLTEATDQRSGAGHRVNQLTRLRDDLAETLRRLDEAEAASGPLRNLAALVNGDNPQKLDLETFAIGAMFDRVLEASNLRLGPMTANRYRLERDLEGAGRGRRGLGIQVFDIFTGKARPTTTLSGGETFIAALALALGLADVVEGASGKIRLDTIFIDEGFGSLDTENGSGTLDLVLQVLSLLVSQNRAVGLISHVPLVQDAIPNGFYVKKHLAGSRVEARGVV